MNKSTELLMQYTNDQLNELVKNTPERPISDVERSAMDRAKELGVEGISNSPVSIANVFNYINSVRFGGQGIFARIENASETSKYETGSEILAIYASDNNIYNTVEQIHGRRLAELQFDCGDYMCTDTATPYKPQPAYYSYGYSKRSLLQREKLENIDDMNAADFVTMLLIQLRHALLADIKGALDATFYSYTSYTDEMSKRTVKSHFKQITEDLEKHVKRRW